MTHTSATGRNHYTADKVTLRSADDWYSVCISWADGASIVVGYDNKSDAIAHINRLGWF